jgi:PAS domain S-box-containing protein
MRLAASVEETTEDLFENAPCGYLTTRLDGTVVKVNRTFESLTGLNRDELLGHRRFQDLLSAGGRIYYETHFAPLLQMQGSVAEIAVEIVRADGSRLPALVNSVLCRDANGQPRAIRTIVFDATERRRYEQELLIARRREQEIAQQLQRSMLSGGLPEAPGLKLEFVYRPAESGLEVGGDWYDAFWLDDGETVGLVVGDVVGRGIAAAATMGQLRSALRALASTGLPPGPLLDALDAYAQRHDVGRMSTLVYARLEVATGRLRYACAGHPPPLLTAPGEEPSFAWGGRSLPLDAAYGPVGPRADAEIRVPRGGALVLYTDGLVELPSRPLTEGMAQLRDLVARDGPAAGAAVRALHETEHGDDVCVLTARLDGG